MPVTLFTSETDTYTYPFSCPSTYANSIKTTLENAGWVLDYESNTDEELYYFDAVSSKLLSGTSTTVEATAEPKPLLYDLNSGDIAFWKGAATGTATGRPASIYLGCKNKFHHVMAKLVTGTAIVSSCDTDPTYEYFDGNTWQSLTSVIDTTVGCSALSSPNKNWSMVTSGNITFDEPAGWQQGHGGELSTSSAYYYIKITNYAPTRAIGASDATRYLNVRCLVPQSVASSATPKNFVSSAVASPFYQIYHMQDAYQDTYPIYIKITYTTDAGINGSFGFNIDIGKGISGTALASSFSIPTTDVTGFGKTAIVNSEYNITYVWYMNAYSSGMNFTHIASAGTNCVGLLLERARDLAGNIIPGKIIALKYNASSNANSSYCYIIDYEFSTNTMTSCLNLAPITYDYDSDFPGKYTTTLGYTLGLGPMFLGSNGMYGAPRLMIFVPYDSLSKGSSISVKQDGVIRSFYLLSQTNTTKKTPYKCWIALART
jgi:hypothetical protein